MKNCNYVTKYLIAIAFIILISTCFIKNGSYLKLDTFFSYLMQNGNTINEGLSVDGIEGDFINSLWGKNRLVDINGLMARWLQMQGNYSNMDMYITKMGGWYIVSASDQTSTDYEYDQTVSFRDFLALHNINLLYVNEPTKYIDDSLFEDEFGVESFSNRNMDLFISRIREEGVLAIDLRENIIQENRKVQDLFYRTDHHWTTYAGLWATRIMADGLNKYCGYTIDLDTYDLSNFEIKEWKACWLGEQGRKVAVTYTGLDDFTEIKPRFETSYTFKNPDGTVYEGSFANFVNESIYDTERNVYENESWHYSYNKINCINNNVEKGKILFIGDSYDHVTIPFLSLGVHEIDSIVLRDCSDGFSLRNYIVENGYDTVIIAYAQFMVGAHDDPSSANYRMFSFEQ